MPTKPDIGKFRHRITIRAKSGAIAFTGAGDLVEAVADLGPYWARVEALSGRELAVAKQIRETISHRITMRTPGPPDATASILFPGIEAGQAGGDRPRSTFEIASIIPDEVGASVTIYATERPSPSVGTPAR